MFYQSNSLSLFQSDTIYIYTQIMFVYLIICLFQIFGKDGYFSFLILKPWNVIIKSKYKHMLSRSYNASAWFSTNYVKSIFSLWIYLLENSLWLMNTVNFRSLSKWNPTLKKSHLVGNEIGCYRQVRRAQILKSAFAFQTIPCTFTHITCTSIFCSHLWKWLINSYKE